MVVESPKGVALGCLLLISVLSSTARAESLEVSLARAASLEEAGQIEEAARLVDELAENYPEDYSVRLRAGWLATREQRFQAAALHYEVAIEVSEGNPEALLGLATARSGERRFDDALEPARRAAEGLADNPRAHLTLAWALYNLDRFDEAEASYRRALELAPESAVARAGLGWCLLRQGERSAARDEFQRALDEDPEYEAALAGQSEARSSIGYDANVRGLAIVGARTPSTMWGGGVSTSLGLQIGSFRPRIAYRYSQLRPADVMVVSGPPGPGGPPPPVIAEAQDSYDSHFIGAGLDYAYRWFDAGVFGGYATGGTDDWNAGLVALHLGARIWAYLSLDSSVLLSDEDPLWQNQLRASFPFTNWLDMWAGFLLTVQGDDVWPAGEAGVRFHGQRWYLDVWGRYGVTLNQFVYHAPALYDFDEQLFWGAGAITSFPISNSDALGLNMQIGFELMGARHEMEDGSEEEGLISLMYLGLQFRWGRGGECRREPCNDR